MAHPDKIRFFINHSTVNEFPHQFLRCFVRKDLTVSEYPNTLFLSDEMKTIWDSTSRALIRFT